VHVVQDDGGTLLGRLGPEFRIRDADRVCVTYIEPRGGKSSEHAGFRILLGVLGDLGTGPDGEIALDGMDLLEVGCHAGSRRGQDES
jgi:hypothetical protein